MICVTSVDEGRCYYCWRKQLRHRMPSIPTKSTGYGVKGRGNLREGRSEEFGSSVNVITWGL